MLRILRRKHRGNSSFTRTVQGDLQNLVFSVLDFFLATGLRVLDLLVQFPGDLKEFFFRACFGWGWVKSKLLVQGTGFLERGFADPVCFQFHQPHHQGFAGISRTQNLARGFFKIVQWGFDDGFA